MVCMKAPTATVALQIALLMTLTACNTGKSPETASPESAAKKEQRDGRPVFGYGREAAAAAGQGEESAAHPREIRPTEIAAEPKARAGLQQRTRTAQAPSAALPSAAPPQAFDRPDGRVRVGDRGVGDPGEVRGATVAARSAPDEGRFLHYRPPGSAVLDPGEVSTSAEESTKLGAAREVIRKWADTLASRKLDAHMALYVSTLTSFYGETDVSRERAGAWKKRLLARDADIRVFEIYRVQLRLTRGGVVDARFRVRTDVPNLGGDYRLELRPDGSGWRISSEQRLGNSHADDTGRTSARHVDRAHNQERLLNLNRGPLHT
jgi:hypothetical protein